jgi:arsenate reductase-like glutaredoxin family protein
MKSKFPKLNELLLSKNEITSIDSLSNINFPKLKILTLNYNKINSIESLSKVKLENIRELKIEKNRLKSIKTLSKVNFPKLSYLSLGDETLGDNIEDLKEAKFPKLQDIFVYLNEKLKNNQKVRKVVDFFENKGICFRFIKYDKNGEEIIDKDINFIYNYDDEEEEDENDINDNKKLIHNKESDDDNFNDFLLKEGLI